MPGTAPDSLAALRREFRARGWHRKATARIVSELVLHSLLSIGGQAIFIFSHGLGIELIGLAISTYGTLGVATNAHTSSHGGTFARRWLNDLLTWYSFAFFVGQATTYWRHSHIVVHHPSPNVVGVDDDADFSPYFASTDREIAEATGLKRVYFAYQWILFPLILWVNAFTRHLSGAKFLARRLRDPIRRRPAHGIDLGVLVLHYAVWIGVPAIALGVWGAIGFYLLRFAALGYPLFAVLAPAHYPAEAAVLAKSNEPADFVRLQTVTTVNFRTGVLGRLVCSGLEYQIEHHLFPSYSHVYYPRMSVLVREFCEREGHPYRTLGWGEACWKTFAIFRTPKCVQPDATALRHGTGASDTMARLDAVE